MKKSFLVLGAIMFALLFAGCKGAEEDSGSGNALQDALLELCETDAAKEYVNLLFDDSLKTNTNIKVAINEDSLTITEDEDDVTKVYLEDSKVKVDSNIDFTVITIKTETTKLGTSLDLVGSEVCLGIVFNEKMLDFTGLGPAL